MATQTNLEQAQLLYVAFYGRPADANGQQFWAGEIEQNGIDAITADFGDSPEFQARFSNLSNEELINNLYLQLFNRDADQGGLEFYTEKLESGELDLANIALIIANNAVDSDKVTLGNKLDVAQQFTDAAGENYSGIDDVNFAREFLSTIDAETDVADLDINAIVSDMPSIDGGESAESTINIDFDNIATAGEIEVNENGQLVIGDGGVEEGTYEAVHNLTGGTTVSNIGKIEWDEAGKVVTSSKDYTFNLDNQIGAGEQYNGLFLSPVLTAENRSANSQLFIDLLDLRTAGTARPLGDLPVNGFRFKVDGETVVLQSEAIFEAETYPELLTAVQGALEETEDPLLQSFEASLGAEFTAKDENGVTQTGTTLVLTDSSGGVIESGNFTYSADASAGGFTLYGEQTTEAPQNIQNLIETNLDLDNVGYGSQGATVNLVGQSNSDKGIEQINVDAENGVWLTRLESNSNIRGGNDHYLKEINLEGDGYFNVGTQDNDNVHGLLDIWQGKGDFGLVDVQDVNGGSFDGDIKLSSMITGDVVARDLNAMDDDADPSADNQTFNYTTAGGDDQLSLALSMDLMAREDANVVIDSGAGDDVVETVIYDNDNWGEWSDLSDQQLNANLTIVTGAGNDVVRTWGQGDAVIDTGADNDVIYADNSGLMITDGEFVGEARDIWAFNSQADAGVGQYWDPKAQQSNSDVNLSAGANGVAQKFSIDKGEGIQVRVDFKGFESAWIDVPSTVGNSNTSITTLQINQAIKDAVNNNHVLKNLIEASDGDGNILNIESLIDGNNLEQLDIGFRGINTNGKTDNSIVKQGIKDIYSVDESAQSTGGLESEAESDNIINAGTGNDVVVLGTGEESNDTVLLKGSFDKNSIVNFTAGEDDVAGFDILDFTSYKVNGNTTVEHDAGYTANAGDNNQVNVTEFAASDFARSGINWGNLNAADVKTAIGQNADNGALNSIIMVEHANNDGLYKTFHVNSANNSTDFTVDLVGVLDFGETQEFADNNIA